MPSSNFMNNMSQGIIYKYTAPDGAVYIGQTAHLRKRIVVGKACTIREATKYMGPNTTAISTVLKGGKEQYNGFIIKCGSIPPTNEEYNAALIKAEMPR